MINNLLHKLVHPAERLSRVACNRRVTVLILRYGRSGWKNFSADFKVRSLSRYRSVVNTYDTIHQQNVVSVAYVAQSSLLAQEAGGFFFVRNKQVLRALPSSRKVSPSLSGM